MSNSLYLKSTIESTEGSSLTYSKGDSVKAYAN